MAIKFNRSQTFATNGTVTAAGLHNLVDGLDIYQALITDQTALTSVGTADKLLIADADLTSADAPRSVTVQELFDDSLTGGTYTQLNLTGNLTYGTATGNRTVSTSATITTGTIHNLTAGTTTGTLATLTNANITNGTIQTLTSSTATITGGTFSGSINSTTGTINNFSTTLAGDLTISQGTATLGTSGVTAGTYGGSSSIPTITVDTKGRVTTASTSALTTGYTGFRNRIINGDMQIDQRNAGALVSGAGNGATQYLLDRWYFFENGSMVFSAQQSSVAPTGFSNSMLMTTTTAATAGSSDRCQLIQRIEGNNIVDLAWGTASAKSVTLSFWVRSSLTGTFGGSLQNSAGDRSYPFTYSISSANTWEQKIVTISGDTSGTWLTDTGVGIALTFDLGMGSSLLGTAGSWASSDFRGATGGVKVSGTLNATWQITGVQLEAGSTATDFERRPYGTELALCQRYYQAFYGNNTGLGLMARFNAPAVGNGIGTTISLHSSMRALPTVTRVGTFNVNNSGQPSFYGDTESVNIYTSSNTSGDCFFYANANVGFTVSAEL